MKKYVLVAAALAVTMSQANAADMYGRGSFKDGPIAPVFSWTGFYIGANVGYGFSDEYANRHLVFAAPGVIYPDPANPFSHTIEMDGYFGGLQAGYNVQNGIFVFGIEGDIQLSDIADRSTTAYPAGPFFFAHTYTAEQDVEWFGTLRARLGLTTDQTLFYVTGGLAFGKVNYSGVYFIPSNNAQAFVDESKTKFGFALGAGLEHALDKNWSLKLEYQYVDLGEDSARSSNFTNGLVTTTEFFTTDYETNFHTVRIGVNYRFDSAPEPLK
jgi:outer membrane immunogenic protein